MWAWAWAWAWEGRGAGPETGNREPPRPPFFVLFFPCTSTRGPGRHVRTRRQKKKKKGNINCSRFCTLNPPLSFAGILLRERGRRPHLDFFKMKIWSFVEHRFEELKFYLQRLPVRMCICIYIFAGARSASTTNPTVGRLPPKRGMTACVCARASSATHSG